MPAEIGSPRHPSRDMTVAYSGRRYHGGGVSAKHTTKWQSPGSREATLDAGEKSLFKASVTHVKSTKRHLQRRWIKIASAGWQPAIGQASREAMKDGEIFLAQDTYRWRSVRVPWDTGGGPPGRDGARVLEYVFQLSSTEGLIDSSALRVTWKLPLSRRIAGAATLVFSGASFVAAAHLNVPASAIAGAAAEWTDALAGCRQSKLHPAQVTNAIGKIHDGAAGLLKNPVRPLKALARIGRGLGAAIRGSQQLEELRAGPGSASNDELASQLILQLSRDLIDADKGGDELHVDWDEWSKEISAAMSNKSLLQTIETGFSDLAKTEIPSLGDARFEAMETLRQLISAGPQDLDDGLLSSISAVKEFSDAVQTEAARLREPDRALREQVIQSFVDGAPNIGTVII